MSTLGMEPCKIYNYRITEKSSMKQITQTIENYLWLSTVKSKISLQISQMTFLATSHQILNICKLMLISLHLLKRFIFSFYEISNKLTMIIKKMYFVSILMFPVSCSCDRWNHLYLKYFASLWLVWWLWAKFTFFMMTLKIKLLSRELTRKSNKTENYHSNLRILKLLIISKRLSHN